MLKLMQTELAGIPASHPTRSVRPCIKANFRVELVEPKHVVSVERAWMREL